ncbi:hypothetical protein MXB_2244, partial [Myxobolus squamalis]
EEFLYHKFIIKTNLLNYFQKVPLVLFSVQYCHFFNEKPQFSLQKVDLFGVINLTLFRMNFFNPNRIDYLLKIQDKDVLSLFLHKHSIKPLEFSCLNQDCDYFCDPFSNLKGDSCICPKDSTLSIEN